MKNHITVLSRATFKELFEVGKQVVKPEYAIISIHEPPGAGKELFGGASDTILDSAPNVLNLWFDDAEGEIPLNHQLWKKFGVDNSETSELVLFNEEMAKQISEFVEVNKDAKFWILHCTAGISRSGAVGSCLADYFGINWFDFKRDNPKVLPNALVRNLLTKVLLQE